MNELSHARSMTMLALIFFGVACLVASVVLGARRKLRPGDDGYKELAMYVFGILSK